jgi:Acetyltransferase (GNAT) domain
MTTTTDILQHSVPFLAKPAPPALAAPTIFHEPWWLDLVTQGRIEAVESSEHGKIVGRLYYLREQRYGISSSNMPAFTHFLGPMIDPGAGSRQTRYLRERSITADLIGKLPKLWSFRQKMHRGVTDVIRFQAAGYDASVQFTFEILPNDEKTIWSGMRDKTRNAIRNGEKLYALSDDLDPEGFIAFYRDNLYSLGQRENINLELARRLTRVCLEQHCGKFLSVKDRLGRLKAAIFIVWDDAACYYLMATRTQDSTYGATAAALWAAIKFAAGSGRIFDFDGISSEGSVKFFAGFGSTVSPRYIVSSATAAYKLLRAMRRYRANVDNPFC